MTVYSSKKVKGLIEKIESRNNLNRYLSQLVFLYSRLFDRRVNEMKEKFSNAGEVISFVKTQSEWGRYVELCELQDALK